MMAARPRTRSEVPATCDCSTTTHFHGTAAMYRRHLCGCDGCLIANQDYVAGSRGFSEAIDSPAPAPEAPSEGLFIATFPYFGGLSRERLARILRPEVARLAAAQGVELRPAELRFRLDTTGAGTFVVVQVPGVSARPVAEVRSRAAELAYQHEQAHPRLAQWITGHLDAGAVAA